jgi:hypothetical protein
MRLVPALLLVAAAATTGGASAADELAAKAAGLVLNPFPSARKVGDTVSTTLHGLAAEVDAANKTAPELVKVTELKGEVSDKWHALTNAARDAAGPLGVKAMATWREVSEVQHAAWVKGNATCKPGAGAVKPGLGAKGEPLSFAFQGSGTLLPYYFGVVQGLQDAGVLTPAVAATAQFGGLSGGSITSVLTALGYSGREMVAILTAVYAELKACLVRTGGDATQCPLFDFVIPGVQAAIEAKGPGAADAVSGRVTIWSCQVNSQAVTNKGSVTMGTSKVR